MTRFLKNTTLASIEEAYGQLHDDSSKSLSLPNSFDNEGGLGITGALIQYLAAWSRAHSDSTLKVSGTPDSPDIYNLAGEPFGTAAIYFASRIEFHSGEILTQQEARRYLLPSVKAMQAWELRKTMKPKGVHLVSFGGAANEFILPFYARRDELSLRDESGFRSLTEKMLNAFSPLTASRLDEVGLTLISQIIFELFSNTHEHARLSEADKPYTQNMRGVLFREIDYRVTVNSQVLAADVPTQQYFARMALNKAHHKADRAINEARVDKIMKGIQEPKRSVSRGATRFLEITVYDSGPGLARNWARRKLKRDIAEVPIAEEDALVRQCFGMHMTTKSGKGRGGGLTGTVSYLSSLDAFMVLRTGRLLLYQDFSRFKEFSPNHWNVKEPPLFEAPGATYTLAIPLGTGKA
ncbi:hypothetical protein [Noviherbaspirillum malthae]|jgi:hypothetical protein|uniref:hypothetical protein n=1 Tax=Noviherbaspirillum malthae TaxID=1260987 RepID=UPI00188DC7D0|nr:hypothetical protein [Noviherbaspirillum malthae]